MGEGAPAPSLIILTYVNANSMARSRTPAISLACSWLCNCQTVTSAPARVDNRQATERAESRKHHLAFFPLSPSSTINNPAECGLPRVQGEDVHDSDQRESIVPRTPRQHRRHEVRERAGRESGRRMEREIFGLQGREEEAEGRQQSREERRQARITRLATIAHTRTVQWLV